MAKKKTTKKKAAEKSTKKVAKKASPKKTQKKSAASASKKTAKKAQKKAVAKKSPSKKAAKKVTKKVAKKVTAKATKKVTSKKVAKKVAKKVTKKVEPKTVKKKEDPIKSQGVKAKESGKKTKVSVQKSDATTKASSNAVKAPKAKSSPESGKEVSVSKDAKTDQQPNKKITKKEKEALTEEIFNLTEEFSFEEVFEAVSQIDFFKSQTDECIVKNCDNPVTTGPYCRLCYIKYWDLIKKKETIIAENKLQFLIEDIIKKYPIRYIEEILKDLSDEKSFFSVLKEMNIDVVDEAYEEAEANLEDEQDLPFDAKSNSRPFNE